MAGEKWEIDVAHSSIGVTVRHMVISKVHGQFTKWEGQLVLDTEALETSSVSVRIEVASIDTREAQRDTHLASPDFFDAAKYPQIVFQSSRIEKAGKDALRVHGALTMHGVTREITLDAEYGGRGKDPWGAERAAFTARAKLDRTDFGLKWNQVLEAGGVLVGETIDIALDLQAKRVA